MKRSRSSPALRVTAVGIETVADDAPAVALDVGDDGDHARRHLAEIDVGVADLRAIGTLAECMADILILITAPGA